MKFELFIAKRILSGSGNGANGSGNRANRIIVNIALTGVILGISIMIIAAAIVTGYQKEIRNKVIGFGSHIQITSFDRLNGIDSRPIDQTQAFYPSLNEVSEVKNIQIYATKAGIIKTKEEIHGIVLKGVSTDYDWDFFKESLVEGETLALTDTSLSKNILLAKSVMDQLNLELGDKINVHFVQQPPRVRRFKISGVFDSGMKQFDDLIAVVDIKHIQKLNNWADKKITGFEVLLHQYEDLDRLDDLIYQHIGIELNTQKITDVHMDILSWLDLLDLNVIIIISLMSLVSGITVISILLILILEKTNMIGLLKAMGAQDRSIRKIFLYNASYLILKGLVIGNLVGISICLLQQQFGIIKLPKETYYISQIPIDMSLWTILTINIVTFFVCLLFMIIPSQIVAKITPIKAIKFN